MGRRKPWLLMLLLAGLGLAISLYLTYLHQQLFSGGLAEPSLCSISRSINCEAVTASPYAEWFGVPIAWFGAMAYLLIIGLAGLGLWRPRSYAIPAWGLILIIAATAAATDAYLAYVMAWRIRSLCLFCLLTYALNLGILVFAFRSLPPPRRAHLLQAMAAALPLSGKTQLALPLLVVAVAATTAFGGMELRKALAHEIGTFDEAAFMRFRADFERIDIDIKDDPFIGAKDAKLTIVEFSDFQCPYCRQAHHILQSILPGYADRVKLVFKNLPLGIDCNPILRARYGRELHPAACGLAGLGEAAHAQGQFWPMHDLIFARQQDFGERALTRRELLDLARDAGLDVTRTAALLDARTTQEAVRRDIEAAYHAGISSTPTFLFNGLLIKGMPPLRVLQRIIAIELGE